MKPATIALLLALCVLGGDLLAAEGIKARRARAARAKPTRVESYWTPEHGFRRRKVLVKPETQNPKPSTTPASSSRPR